MWFNMMEAHYHESITHFGNNRYYIIFRYPNEFSVEVDNTSYIISSSLEIPNTMYSLITYKTFDDWLIDEFVDISIERRLFANCNITILMNNVENIAARFKKMLEIKRRMK